MIEVNNFYRTFYTDKNHGINPRDHLYITFADFIEKALQLQPY